MEAEAGAAEGSGQAADEGQFGADGRSNASHCRDKRYLHPLEAGAHFLKHLLDGAAECVAVLPQDRPGDASGEAFWSSPGFLDT